MGGGGGIFARSNYKLKLFLSDFWYEPENLWLFLTFTRDYSAEEKLKKVLNFRRVTYFFTGVIVKKMEFGYVGIVWVTETNAYMN